jgi:predicted  nucleic acid-binding Zn-ribbon protein
MADRYITTTEQIKNLQNRMHHAEERQRSLQLTLDDISVQIGLLADEVSEGVDNG